MTNNVLSFHFRQCRSLPHMTNPLTPLLSRQASNTAPLLYLSCAPAKTNFRTKQFYVYWRSQAYPSPGGGCSFPFALLAEKRETRKKEERTRYITAPLLHLVHILSSPCLLCSQIDVKAAFTEESVNLSLIGTDAKNQRPLRASNAPHVHDRQSIVTLKLLNNFGNRTL